MYTEMSSSLQTETGDYPILVDCNISVQIVRGQGPRPHSAGGVIVVDVEN